MEKLASVTQLSSYVVRILGQNPGKFTLQGTNTYLAGEHYPFILIDTGEGKPEYTPLLQSVLSSRTSDAPKGQQLISDIIISHWHLDHVGGLPSVLALLRRLWDEQNTSLPFKPPRVHKFPLAANPDDRLSIVLQGISPGTYEPGPTNSLFHDLEDNQAFSITVLDSSKPTAEMLVVHSPGHTKDSVCLLCPFDDALYTVDTVLGEGTAVFEDLATYISSLRLLLSMRDEYTRLYPGHGPVVENGAELISSYISHRMQREEEILALLKQPAPKGKAWSTWDIVSKIYAEYPSNLWDAAAKGVDQHLQKLVKDGRVQRLGGEGKHTLWKLIQ